MSKGALTVLQEKLPKPDWKEITTEHNAPRTQDRTLLLQSARCLCALMDLTLAMCTSVLLRCAAYRAHEPTFFFRVDRFWIYRVFLSERQSPKLFWDIRQWISSNLPWLILTSLMGAPPDRSSFDRNCSCGGWRAAANHWPTQLIPPYWLEEVGSFCSYLHSGGDVRLNMT